MKTLIVYYSMNGNTAYAAEKIAGLLGADTVRVEPVRAYPTKGLGKFFHGGKSAVFGEKPELKPYRADVSAYETVIFGFPVWAGNVAPPIRTFIAENEDALRNKRVAAFACQSGSGAEKAFDKLEQCPGIGNLEKVLVLIDPKDRPSPDNERRIREFCGKESNPTVS